MWCIKKWNKQLAGENFDWLFPVIQKKREYIAEKYRFSKRGWKRADSSYPMIESLNKTWFYGLIAGYNPKLFPVPELSIRHKEPTDKWVKITGIKMDHDQDLIEKPISSKSTKASKSDEKALAELLIELKSRKGKEKLSNPHIQQIVSKKQEDTTINWNTSIIAMKPNTFSQTVSRLIRKYSE